MVVKCFFLEKKEFMQPGERIRAFRKEKGLTQREVADALGYSDAFLSEIERGVSGASREFLKKLNEVFGISSDYILYGDSPDQTDVELAVPPEQYIEEEKRVLIIREPESKYQILPTATKKLIDNMVEILQSDNEVMIDALKANIKAFLTAVRSKKQNDEDKSKGDD
jgi:transcriptional regulator with XRE-family HTH domain